MSCATPTPDVTDQGRVGTPRLPFGKRVTVEVVRWSGRWSAMSICLGFAGCSFTGSWHVCMCANESRCITLLLCILCPMCLFTNNPTAAKSIWFGEFFQKKKQMGSTSSVYQHPQRLSQGTVCQRESRKQKSNIPVLNMEKPRNHQALDEPAAGRK